MTAAISEADVVRACKTLFGEHINISRDFLSYLQPSGAKSAYRKKAKENHPDIFAKHPLHVQQKQTALFREILRAYDVITVYFKQRETKAPFSSSSPPGGAADVRKRRPSPAAAAEQPTRRRGDDGFYSGMVPSRTLQIGQYLYYRGKISFSTLINSLVWQRKQRPSIGEIAARWGWLDKEGMEKISRSCERPRRFGEKAVELGLLTVFQVNAILLYQRSNQIRLGRYYVTHKILAPGELERMVQELNRHNALVLSGSDRSARRSRPAV